MSVQSVRCVLAGAVVRAAVTHPARISALDFSGRFAGANAILKLSVVSGDQLIFAPAVEFAWGASFTLHTMDSEGALSNVETVTIHVVKVVAPALRFERS